ncbi:hypothetical protein RIF29_27187 [Crotalaria pallida]|uniref:Uncharacterized protein n=1 Tax=Crotalaria pallida TaxID=3830 RepID=A0AAN9HYI7_CROPI
MARRHEITLSDVKAEGINIAEKDIVEGKEVFNKCLVKDCNGIDDEDVEEDIGDYPYMATPPVDLPMEVENIVDSLLSIQLQKEGYDGAVKDTNEDEATSKKKASSVGMTNERASKQTKKKGKWVRLKHVAKTKLPQDMDVPSLGKRQLFDIPITEVDEYEGVVPVSKRL